MKIMTIIAPNSLVHQKEGAGGEEEEVAGGRRKGGSTGSITPGTDAPTVQVQLGQWCRVRGTGENMDDSVGFHSTGGAERAWD